MVWLLFREKVPRSTFDQTEKVRKPRFLRAVSGNPPKDARENFRLLKDFLLNRVSHFLRIDYLKTKIVAILLTLKGHSTCRTKIDIC